MLWSVWTVYVSLQSSLSRVFAYAATTRVIFLSEHLHAFVYNAVPV